MQPVGGEPAWGSFRTAVLCSAQNLRRKIFDFLFTIFSVIILFVPLFSKMEFIRLFATSGKLVKWLYCAKESGERAAAKGGEGAPPTLRHLRFGATLGGAAVHTFERRNTKEKTPLPN